MAVVAVLAIVVPTLVDDAGRVIVESSTIMRYFDEAFAGPAGPAFQPTDPYQRTLMKLMDEEMFPAIGYFATATLLREGLLSVPRDALVKRLTQFAGTAVRPMRADAVWNGVEKTFAAMER